MALISWLDLYDWVDLFGWSGHGAWMYDPSGSGSPRTHPGNHHPGEPHGATGNAGAVIPSAHGGVRKPPRSHSWRAVG